MAQHISEENFLCLLIITSLLPSCVHIMSHNKNMLSTASQKNILKLFYDILIGKDNLLL